MREFDIVTAEQRSPEWFAARLGRLTGSRAADMLATVKAGEAAARRDLRAQLVCERLTNTLQEDGYVNSAIQRGIDCEPLARQAYEALTGEVAHQTGFLAHRTLAVGCSLDGHIGDFAGILELKCPKSATHLAYLRAGQVPATYIPQITHNLWVSGAAFCDFLSFDDRFPVGLQTCLIRVERNEQYIASYALAASLFLAEVAAEVEAVKGLRAA
jgi:predicted phage-related endonuclease